MDSKNLERRWALIFSASLYLLALLFPGFVPAGGGSGPGEVAGFQCFLLGFLAFMDIGKNPMGLLAWSANFFVVFALLSLRGRRTVLKSAFALLPLLISLSVFRIEEFIVSPENASYAAVQAGAGAYLWIGSFLALAAARFLYDPVESSLSI